MTCAKSDTDYASYLNPYFLMFLLGQTLHGIGATPLFSIGTAYLDENVSQKASPVYLGEIYLPDINVVFTFLFPIIATFIEFFLLSGKWDRR